MEEAPPLSSLTLALPEVVGFSLRPGEVSANRGEEEERKQPCLFFHFSF